MKYMPDANSIRNIEEICNVIETTDVDHKQVKLLNGNIDYISWTL